MSIERLNRHQRPIAKCIIVRGTLILDTPTCLGSGDADSPTDLALLRDSISDHALLTGSSIAGALRNYLREYEHGYVTGEQECDRATSLFGGTRRNDDGEQSPLIVNDAISSKIPTVELRDGVEIEGKTGTAKKGQKYDLELLSAGTEFPLYFELLVEQKRDKTKQLNYEDRLVKSLALALRGLELGEISIGMKKRRGFGRCTVKAWQVWEFDLTQDEKRLEWLLFEHWCTELSPEYETYSSIATAFGVSLDEEEDKRDRFFLEATFKLASPLLIRSGQDSTGCAPDVVHLRSHRDGELKPVLSGTSLAGVLRHRAERIVNTLDKPEKMAQKIVNDVFGFVEKNSKQAKASRLVVHESVIENTAELVQNRIAIDRFTGGTYHGALFSEQPIFGSDETRLTLELELRQPRKAEIGLLLLLLKDLWTSDLPVGGESSIGRGRLQGIKAKMRRQIPGKATQTWTIFQDGEHLQISDANGLEAFVIDFSGELIE
ncbi:MAG: RAMP superfamily CRISPR-associated protein [Coleofasciculus sp. D1-CHI-01]|uniref:RAMP superfamily CRISPR-associated protein n=1 Tax=Coleofasciculus sp. D1-CHI-01 TaxID=3068482 RepID=UPI0032F80712